MKNLEFTRKLTNMKNLKFTRKLFFVTSLIIIIAAMVIPKSKLIDSIIGILIIGISILFDIQAPQIANISEDNPKVKTMRLLNRILIFIIIICTIFAIFSPIKSLFSTKTNEVILVGLISIFIMFFGNLAPKIPFNRYLGLRLPWTISDEDTWKIAHKILGYVSFPIAIVMFILSLYFSDVIIILVGICILILIPGLYSLLFYYRKTKGIDIKTEGASGYKMKFNKKDLLILVIPVFIVILLIPVLPDKIPMQFDFNGNVHWYLYKQLYFIIGLIPFIIYKSYKIIHHDR